jgi:hypothetical protein
MDYPRDYIIPNQEIELGTAFVVMPIRPEFDLPLGIITDVCNTLGIKARRADDIARQDFIMSNILDGIAKSEIVIVDITGNNPNVFYELGIAHSLRTRQAIIIITQDEDVSKSPFDIRHWSILQYDTKNLPLFRVNLNKKIRDCRNFVDYDEYIFGLLKSYAFDGNQIHEFINSSKLINEKKIQLICNILVENTNPTLCDSNELHEIYTYLTTLGDIQNGIFKKISWILKTLVYTTEFVLSKHLDTIKNMFLNRWQKENMIVMNDTDYWELVANICSKIIEKKYKGKEDAIQWMTSYLQNQRMGRIDRVRGKIEDFLMTVKDNDVDKAVLDLIKNGNITARESAIDISGQKPIIESADILLQIISKNESNPYIIRSSINALARMKITSAGPFILEWMENNRDKWGQQAVSASLRKVAEEALNEIDKKSYLQLVNLK